TIGPQSSVGKPASQVGSGRQAVLGIKALRRASSFCMACSASPVAEGICCSSDVFLLVNNSRMASRRFSKVMSLSLQQRSQEADTITGIIRRAGLRLGLEGSRKEAAKGNKKLTASRFAPDRARW